MWGTIYWALYICQTNKKGVNVLVITLRIRRSKQLGMNELYKQLEDCPIIYYWKQAALIVIFTVNYWYTSSLMQVGKTTVARSNATSWYSTI